MPLKMSADRYNLSARSKAKNRIELRITLAYAHARTRRMAAREIHNGCEGIGAQWARENEKEKPRMQTIHCECTTRSHYINSYYATNLFRYFSNVIGVKSAKYPYT